MTFLSSSSSHTAYFPVNLPINERSITQIRIPIRKTPKLTNNKSVRLLQSFVQTGGSVSVAVTNKKNEQDCGSGMIRGKGWVHFVGVGGCGMSALAMLALKQGYEVSGSDVKWSFFMEGLGKAGACLHIGHSESHIQRDHGSISPNAIVISSAISQDNVEILHANSVGVPVYKRGDWLRKITKDQNLIAISGSHGKSTTSAMLAYVLKAMGDDVTAVIGAHVPQFPEGNVLVGGGRNFVLEADEYDGCFLGLSPQIAVVTNIDWEHVDIFKTEEDVKAIFKKFLKQTRVGGHLIICKDSAGACSLLDQIKQEMVLDYSSSMMSESGSVLDGHGLNVTTYGISSSNDWHASSVCQTLGGGCNYILCHKGHPVADISLQIPGDHNIQNSLAVIAAVTALTKDQQHPFETVNLMKSHLKTFKGISRRFEMIGSICGCHIYDDYAHHPTEVRAVLHVARQIFPSKFFLAVFQPHSYSRLAALKDEFAAAFTEADQIVVTGVYAARDADVWGVSGKDLAASIVGPPSEYIPDLEQVVHELVLRISSDPHREIVVLTLGSGDITTIGPRLLYELQQRLKSSTVGSLYI